MTIKHIALVSPFSLLVACASTAVDERAGYERVLAQHGLVVMLDNMEGKVGHHLSTKFTVPGDVIKNLCPGEWAWRGSPQFIGGSLPSGLRLEDFPSRIEGTPQQPGEWRFTLRWTGLGCGRSGRELPDTIRDYWMRIEGDAPRRVR